MQEGHHRHGQQDPRAPRPSTGPGRVLQAYEVAMVVLLTGFVGVGVSALGLAVVGAARPPAVAVAGLLLWAGLLKAWGPLRQPPPADGHRWPVVLVGVAVVLASGAYNLRNQGEYVVTDRDPGIYVNGGQWIADHGDLVVDGAEDELHEIDGVVSWAAGQSADDDDPGRLQIQGAHLFHTSLAVGEWVGGAAGFAAAPAAVGTLALAMFLWLALRLLPDWAAVLATVALAVDFAWIYTVRSILSEPTLLLLSFGGAVLLLDATRGPAAARGRFLVAGFVAATALTARVDAGVVILAFPVLVALLARRRDPAGAGRALVWWLAGCIVPVVVAVADLRLRSPRYLSDLGSEVVLVVAGLVASTLTACAVVAAGSPRWRDTVERSAARVRPHLPRLAAVVAVAVVAVAAFAWFVRPHLGPDRLRRDSDGWRVMESVQVHEGLAPDGTRTYAERSLDRVSWYTGPVALVAGVAGLAVVAWRLVRGRLTDSEWVVAGLVVPCLLLYLYAPSIYSDHPWMIRRYVPTAIPGIILFGAVAAVAASRWSRLPTAPRWAVVALVVGGSIIGPLRTTWPLRAATWQSGGRDGVERLCSTFGTDDVAVLASDGSTALTLLPAVRSFCEVEAVGLEPQIDAESGAPVVAAVLEEVADDGRAVHVVAPTRQVLTTLAPDAGDLRTVNILQTSRVGTTIGRVPDLVGEHTLTVWVGTLEPR